MKQQLNTALKICAGIMLLAFGLLIFESRGRFLQSRFGVLGLFLIFIMGAVLWCNRSIQNKTTDNPTENEKP